MTEHVNRRVIRHWAAVAALISLVTFMESYVCAEDLNPVIGKAGDYVLREADLDRMLSNQSPEARKLVETSPEQRSNFIRQFLLTKAVSAKARKEGFDKKPETRELLSNLVDQFLAQEYLSKVVAPELSVPDDELKKYYAEHTKEFQIPEAVKVRHILVSSPKDSAAELRDKAKAKADGILSQITTGADFAKTATAVSEDADSASKGGDLGFISPGKTNSLEFEKAAFALKTGEISKVVETPFGYHIIKVEERKEARNATFEEAKDYIANLLKEEKRKKKIQDFIEKTTRDTGLEITGSAVAEPATSK